MMAESTFNGLDTFKHVVVLMLENRSFDNLLGYLYEDGVPEGKNYAGLQGSNFKIQVPKCVKDHQEHPYLSPYKGRDYHLPFPDPGEVYQHVNTQIYNHIDAKNLDKQACHMKRPYNLPKPTPECPPMNGFINDYVNTLKAIKCTECKDEPECKDGQNKDSKKCKECEACDGYHDPGYKQYKGIMQCFEPNSVGVLSKLAKEFAVFDHWYCSVPSQTWCNRAFWHAGTSGGRVINPTDQCGMNIIFALLSWIWRVWTKKTLFQRMRENKVSHAVYTSGWISLTSLVNGPFKYENVLRSGEKLKAFKSDVAKGTLPKYSFIEPKFIGKHNDQHPSSAFKSLLNVDGPQRIGSVILGEQLIWDVYDTLRKSDYWKDTLLIITHDEHGGCYDHVPPPPCHGDKVVPPKKHMWCNQKGFNFKRLGIRVPMVMVSAHIQPNTIINEQFEHTSFIRTMCKKWGMKGFTNRDKSANSFEHIFTSEKREWPRINPPMMPLDGANEDHYDEDPLNDLQRSMLVTARALAYIRQKKRNPFKRVPSIRGIKTVKEAKDFMENKKVKKLLKGHLTVDKK